MKGISWNAKVAMLATFSMGLLSIIQCILNRIAYTQVYHTLLNCMAFTILVSSAYIFALRLLVHPSSLPKVIHQAPAEVTIEQAPLTEAHPDLIFDAKNITQEVVQEVVLERIPRSWLYGEVKTDSKINLTQKYRDEWVSFRRTWGNSMTFVLSSSAFVFMGGLIQFFSSLFIVMNARGSSPKFLRRSTIRWMVSSIVVCFILIICVTSNGALGSDPEYTLQFSGILNEKTSDVDEIFRPSWLNFMISNIYNLVVLLDACGLVCLIGIAACLLNMQPMVLEFGENKTFAS